MQADGADFAAKHGLSPEAFREKQRALARGELRAGVSAKEMDSLFSAQRRYNAFAPLLGRPPAHVPLNHARLVDELLAVHGYQVWGGRERGALSRGF